MVSPKVLRVAVVAGVAGLVGGVGVVVVAIHIGTDAVAIGITDASTGSGAPMRYRTHLPGHLQWSGRRRRGRFRQWGMAFRRSCRIRLPGRFRLPGCRRYRQFRRWGMAFRRSYRIRLPGHFRLQGLPSLQAVPAAGHGVPAQLRLRLPYHCRLPGCHHRKAVPTVGGGTPPQLQLASKHHYRLRGYHHYKPFLVARQGVPAQLQKPSSRSLTVAGLPSSQAVPAVGHGVPAQLQAPSSWSFSVAGLPSSQAVPAAGAWRSAQLQNPSSWSFPVAGLPSLQGSGCGAWRSGAVTESVFLVVSGCWVAVVAGGSGCWAWRSGAVAVSVFLVIFGCWVAVVTGSSGCEAWRSGAVTESVFWSFPVAGLPSLQAVPAVDRKAFRRSYRIRLPGRFRLLGCRRCRRFRCCWAWRSGALQAPSSWSFSVAGLPSCRQFRLQARRSGAVTESVFLVIAGCWVAVVAGSSGGGAGVPAQLQNPSSWSFSVAGLPSLQGTSCWAWRSGAIAVGVDAIIGRRVVTIVAGVADVGNARRVGQSGGLEKATHSWGAFSMPLQRIRRYGRRYPR